MNKRELAEIFGVSERTFTAYQKDESFPVAEYGGRGQSNVYDTAAVYEWLIQRAVNGAKFETAKERLDRIRGDREELALAKDLEELVPAVDLLSKLEPVFLAIRTEMLNGDVKLKTEIDTLYGIDTDIELFNDHSREILGHLASLGEQFGPGDREGSGEIPAAAEDDID